MSELSKSVTVATSGQCRIDALMVWIEFSLDNDETLTTNNSRHKQLVHMLHDSIEVSGRSIQVQCCARIGNEVDGDADHKFEVKPVAD